MVTRDNIGSVRASALLVGFLLFTVPLMPVQELLLRCAPRAARVFPNWYHRRVCGLFGIRVRIIGEVPQDRPVLLVANHVSWLDIPVISSVAPLSFVAKKEVTTWSFVSILARLQRSVVVDRDRRTTVGVTSNEIMERLAQGDTVVLFPEGTSTDGNRVLPFKTSLFAAAKPSGGAREPVPNVCVQTLSLVYTMLHGIPIGREGRPLFGFYGDMEMKSHAWQVLKAGPIDCTIVLGTPIPLEDFKDRKDLALRSEAEVRLNVVRTLRGRAEDAGLVVTEVSADERKASRVPVGRLPVPGAGWR